MADKGKIRYQVQHTLIDVHTFDKDGKRVGYNEYRHGDILTGEQLGDSLDRFLTIGAVAPYQSGDADKPLEVPAQPSGIVNSAGRDDATGHALIVNRDGVPVKLSAEEAAKVDTASAKEATDRDAKGKK